MKVSTNKSTKAFTGNQDWGRFGRPLKPGTHDCEILDVKEEQLSSESGPLSRLTLTLKVTASADAAPEGAVKIDHRCTEGNFTMDNLVEIAYPDSLGVANAEVDPKKLIGAKLKVTTRTMPAKDKPDGTQWPERATTYRLVGPIVFGTPAEESPF